SAAAADALQTPVQYLKGVGPRRAGDLASVGVQTVEDLLLTLPRRYDDRAILQSIRDLRPGEATTISGTVLSCGLRTTRRPGFRIFEMLVQDASGRVRVAFLNQAFLKDVFAARQQVVLHGRVDRRPTGGLQITNPDHEIVSDEEDDARGEPIHTGRIVPVYEKIGSLTPKSLRRVVHDALQRLPAEVDDPLPDGVRRSLGAPPRRQALAEAHFPPPGTSIDALDRFGTPAQQRLVFEEFFFFQVGLLLRRRESDTRVKPRRIVVDDRIRQAARDLLPFRLTGHQRQALKEIVEDLQRPRPMNRLLQGDVGSGKTIVALLAALVAMENGLQVAFMAPTEILAEQHHASISRVLSQSRFAAALLTGTLPARTRREAASRIANGASQLVVGTHALVQGDVRFRALGLAIVDEQHRFGVVQRAILRDKGLDPDVLVMTATPIPRTLALTAYGDLDVSEIRERLPGRHPVKTQIRSEARRTETYDLVRTELRAGRQAFVVCPLVEESEKLDLRAATEMAAELQARVFPDARVGLVHGRMATAERERTMAAFAAGRIDVLVATTVIEVGIDVPNATVMVIEQAERFGLAQLHQLRGRVGRGAARACCVLMHAARLSDAAGARLRALAGTTDGFEIAERDLELRGPGDFFGTRQSGVPLFRVGDLLRDHRLMEEARRAAAAWIDGAEATGPRLDAVRGAWTRRFGLAGVA
ncbi:MAG: ATP-dependent DNA helicase RecG, partial [Acidobacteria bacterium]|nr:ATP-dependent DNA helicase RecG [Acidobacteriota bacterium]